MPKDRRSRSVSFDRPSPFPSRSSNRRRYSPHPSSTSSAEGVSSSSKHPPRSMAPASKDLKEWDEVRCPVCMEHPHNAVLLLCASHDKGCRPFMCDTSYRHSNCLDQYRKAFDAVTEAEIVTEPKVELSCPLCRGVVSGCKVVEAARRYMNAKLRSCSTESCGYAGAYRELRRHARMVHPLVRPSEADPERQRDWRRIERQRDLGDLFSMMQSAVDGGDDGPDIEFGGRFPFPTITLFLVLRFRESEVSIGRGSAISPRSRRAGVEARWGDLVAGAEPTDLPVSNIDDHGDSDHHHQDNDRSSGGHYGIVPVISVRRRRRNREPLRSNDDDDDDDDDEVDHVE